MRPLIEKIVVPVDFSDASEHAARYACALARNLGSTVYLIHVLEPPMKGPVRSSEVGGADERPYRDARQRLSALARRLGASALRITTEVRCGKVAEDINDCVIAYGADLVVMSTRGLTGLPHLLLGSVAEHVVRTACCPVLVVRHSGQIRLHRRAPSLQQQEEHVAEACPA